ncbi:hypothetical protein [Thermomonospora cellulosilytica]|uniref:TrbL/VirB6 plasmid conjugal transfer protein n=1 Tax=Thermomonospora cellulosilytica TaxID=1411118 RepID=A0A7W3MWA5_9ACTN|nr:hypothetical protein [Thermomonospora cellulosilytica]MBA9003087.1 hypothetical protein [Thermomonospora cellulosilytica]
MAKEAVNGWFQELVTSAAKPVFRFLGDTVLGTPEVDSAEMARARQLWGASQVIANTCFVLLVAFAGVLVMSGQTVPGGLAPGEVLPRLVPAFIAANVSLIFVGHGISFANGLAQAFLQSGAEAIDAGVVADSLGGSVVALVATGGTFYALVALAVIVMALIVAFIYIVRLAITMVLVAAAPVALMFHALPVTEGIARLWWRGITGVLAIQVCQALVLATVFRLLFSEVEENDGEVLGISPQADLTDLLVAIALLWVLIRIPSWVARSVWQPAQPRLLGQMLKTFVLYRSVGALMNRRGGGMSQGLVKHGGRRPAPRPAAPAGRGRGAPPPPTSAGLGSSRQPPTAPSGSNEPEEGEAPASGRAVQLALPIPIQRKPQKARPVQLALPIKVTRVPRPPAPKPPAGAGRPRARSRQLMLPGMPKRPVPRRQLTLRIDPPKRNGGTS